MKYYVVEDGQLFVFPSATHLKNWVLESQKLQTFPTECGAEALGPILHGSNLTENIVEQFILQDQMDKEHKNIKPIKKRQRYKNRCRQ